MSTACRLTSVLVCCAVLACSNPISQRDIYLGPPGSSVTHAVVTLVGDARLDVWRVRSTVTVDGQTHSALLPEQVPTEALHLPQDYVVTSNNHGGDLGVLAEALDQQGFVIGRGRATHALKRNSGVAMEIALGTPCDAPRDCQDADFCNGPEVCTDGVCGPGSPRDNGTPCDSGVCVSGACTPSRCGDGFRDERSGEKCDQGSHNSATLPNVCRPDCTLPHCGDGVRDDGEECDDGNTSNEDGCLSNCVVNQCGDGFRNPATEECDDGNASNADTCLVNCRRNTCGDGVVNPAAEECDDGNAATGDGCLPTCQLNRCGDGFLNPMTEECDDGNSVDEDACLSNCQRNTCGDGITDPAAEECDDGNLQNDDGCLTNCRRNSCGDGFRDLRTEACDDGNLDDSDACLATCTLNSCGDGFVNLGTEACDDGNTVSGDGCRGDCGKVERCGDSVVDSGEDCDDGNSNPNDGCDACHHTVWRARVLAGTGPGGSEPLRTPLGWTSGVAVDRADQVYVAAGTRVWRMSADGTSVVAAAGSGAYCEDDYPVLATSACLPDTAGVAVDGRGNLFFSATALTFRFMFEFPFFEFVEWGCVRSVDPKTGLLVTVAGACRDPEEGSAADGIPAVTARLVYPVGLAVDGAGNLFIADQGDGKVRRVDVETGIIRTVAGGGPNQGDGILATQAVLVGPAGLSLDRGGNLFISEAGGCRVRRVDAVTGVITTVAGTGACADGPDGQPATQVSLQYPIGIHVDNDGNLFVADSDAHVVRRVDHTTGLLTTVAGMHAPGFQGDQAPATQALLDGPRGVTGRRDGTLFIADSNNLRVRRVALDGTITTAAGGSSAGCCGDGNAPEGATLNSPKHVSLTPQGELLVTDSANNRVRKVSFRERVISTVMGGGPRNAPSQGLPALSAYLDAPTAAVQDHAGNLYVVEDGQARVRRVDAVTGIVSISAGTGNSGWSGDNGPAAQAELGSPAGLLVDGQDNLYVGDFTHGVVRRVDGATHVITTVAGNGSVGSSGDHGPATSAQLGNPAGLAMDAQGNLFIADLSQSRVRRVAAVTGEITTVAGTGENASGEDGAPAVAASLQAPSGVAVDGAGNLFIADRNANKVRRVDGRSSIITTLAGTGTAGFSGDGGAAALAQLNEPYSVAADGAGNVYIADYWYNCVRRVDARTGTISSAVGCGGSLGDGALSASLLGEPAALVLAPGGTSLLVADAVRNRLRRAALDQSWMDSVAGYFMGTGTQARYAALLAEPRGLALDASRGVLFVAETDSHVIRSVQDVRNPLDQWQLGLVAGTEFLAGQDNGPLTTARFNQPTGLALSPDGSQLYVADYGSNSVRRVDLSSQEVHCAAGIPGFAGYDGDGLVATDSLLDHPSGVAVAADGTLYIADTLNERVRAVMLDGRMTDVLGDGTPGSGAAGSPARYVAVNHPRGLAVDRHGNLFVTSRTSLRVVTAGTDGRAGGEDEVLTIYGAPPRSAFPDSATACLAAVELSPAGDQAWVADACTGFIIELTRQTRSSAGP